MKNINVGDIVQVEEYAYLSHKGIGLVRDYDLGAQEYRVLIEGKAKWVPEEKLTPVSNQPAYNPDIECLRNDTIFSDMLEITNSLPSHLKPISEAIREFIYQTYSRDSEAYYAILQDTISALFSWQGYENTLAEAKKED